MTTATSTNPRLSVLAFAHTAGLCLLFWVVYRGSRYYSLGAMFVPLVPAVVNAAVALAQATGLWNPFFTQQELEAVIGPRLGNTALVGNPNDVGVYLVAPALASAVLALRGRRRLLFASTLLLCTAAIFATLTLTAIAALGLALGALAFRIWPRRVAVVTGVLAGALVVMTIVLPPLNARIYGLADAVATGDLERILSGRWTSFVVAARMIRTRPLLGMGPGTFGWHFLPFKTAAERNDPSIFRTTTVNFGEVHNDHLELAAESGVPAFVLFNLALLALARLSFGARPISGRTAVAKRLSLPLAVALFVLSLAQFPLQLSAVSVTVVFVAALCAGWNELDENP